MWLRHGDAAILPNGQRATTCTTTSWGIPQQKSFYERFSVSSSLKKVVCMCSCFSARVQGFFERGKWSIVLERKWGWQGSRKCSDQRLCDWPGMWNAVSPSQWIGGKGLGTDTKPSERHDCALFQTAVILTPLRFVYVGVPFPRCPFTLTRACIHIIYLSVFAVLFAEVTLKIHLSDASTHQPLGGVSIQLFANHTSITAETSSAEGNTYLRFPYRLGTPLVVTATKQGYVPNSVPWTPSRLPGKTSVSVHGVCNVCVWGEAGALPLNSHFTLLVFRWWISVCAACLWCPSAWHVNSVCLCQVCELVMRRALHY